MAAVIFLKETLKQKFILKKRAYTAFAERQERAGQILQTYRPCS